MGLFGSNNPYSEPLAKLTSELNTDTDWGAILELCDKIKESPKGPQDFCYIIFNKLSHKIPHVSMQALTVLDACVNNCGKEFHKEMASQNFTESIREFLYSYKNPTVVTRMKYLVRKWAEEFKSDPALAHFVSIYYYLRGEGMEFPEEDESDPQRKNKSTTVVPTNPDAVSSQQEAEDIAKAIEASLKEEKAKSNRKGTTTTTTSSLYPAVQLGASTSNTSQSSYSSPSYSTAMGNREKRKVKALYDFEAAEDNELTFHTGDVISILDDSDVNWWKGEGANGVGLFPANFVTSDLKAQPEPEVGSASRVSFSETAQVKEIIASEPVLSVDEDLIDRTLLTLQNTDPEFSTEDSPELLRDEETCRQMEQLIDSRLQKIDAEHLDLTLLNEKILESLRMYDNLMKELPAYGNPQMLKHGQGMPMQQQQPGMQGMPPYMALGMQYQGQPQQQYGAPPMGMDNTQGPMQRGMMPIQQQQQQYNNMYQQQMGQQQQQQGPPPAQMSQQQLPDQQQQGYAADNQSQYVMDPNQNAGQQVSQQSFQGHQPAVVAASSSHNIQSVQQQDFN